MGIKFVYELDKFMLEVNTQSTNQLTFYALQKMLHYVEKLEDYASGIVLIMSDEKNYFSSGLCLSEAFRGDNQGQTYNNIIKLVKLVHCINASIIRSKHIYVIAMNGGVIGSAFSIALACDIRIASASTWVWLPDPQFGGIMLDGAIELLGYRASTSICAQMMLTNRRFGVDKLVNWGLVLNAYDNDKFFEGVNIEINRLSRLSFVTLSYTKKIMNEHINLEFRENTLWEVLHNGNAYECLKNTLAER